MKNLGIPPRTARNASLTDITSQLPAAVFNRLLGFSQSVRRPKGVLMMTPVTFDQPAYGDGLFAEPYALSQDR